MIRMALFILYNMNNTTQPHSFTHHSTVRIFRHFLVSYPIKKLKLKLQILIFQESLKVIICYQFSRWQSLYLRCASSIYKALRHKFISDALLMNHDRCLNVKQSLQSSSQITEYIQKRCECYMFFPNPHYICGNNFSQLIKLIIWYKITGPVFPFSRKPS